jgi:hypothetical protein
MIRTGRFGARCARCYLARRSEPVAFALLRQFKQGQIVFLGGVNFGASKVRDLWKERGPNLQQKKIGVNAQSGAVGKVVSRLLPEEIADPDSANFKGFVVRPLNNGVSLAKPGQVNDNPTIVFSSERNLGLPE